MTAFYNDNDPLTSHWLSELIREGHITDGNVDARSITRIQPSDVSGYDRVHLFAGIGGWDFALQLAGWPEGCEVWTGSCPCQPLSCAGLGLGEEDERHLWPEFYRLISECRPATIFGEQVADGAGLEWFDGISLDMEELGYAVGAADLPAACVNAPHRRQRLFWVADRNGGRCEQFDEGQWSVSIAHPHGTTRGMADSERNGRRPDESERRQEGRVADGGISAGMGNASRGGRRELRDAARSGLRGHTIGTDWSRFDTIHCRDGKSRRIEPGSSPLVTGLPERVGLLLGYGNAIVPDVAAVFVKAFMDICHEN